MQVINVDNGTPIFSWCPNIEESALNQMKALSRLPFIKHCALMPDAHTGMSMPIGGVIGSVGVVLPSAVGVDIGCGLGAVKTSLKASDLSQDAKEKLLHSFGRSIPVGFDHNNDRRIADLKVHYREKVDYIISKHMSNEKVIKEFNPISGYLTETIFSQLGTLGGGNHFLEIQRDEQDNVWIMIHSGSRNIGKKVCDYFDELALNEGRRWYSSASDTVGFLPTDTELGKAYLTWMDTALAFAFLNRKVMLDAVMKDITHLYPTVEFDKLINIHHNFASQENHFGQNMWVHRKGSTKADSGLTGIIPGSMGTNSYITEGMGDPKSLNSCSHGAGRISSRTEFNKKMNTEQGIKEIEASMSGIVHSKFQKEISRKRKETGQLDVSEAPQAYKNIDEVMNHQKDLVRVIVKLTPLINMKG